MLIIPEIAIFKVLKSILITIENDYKEEINEKNTILYNLFNGNNLGNFNYFEQAKALFLKTIDDSRKIEVRMFFAAERASLPTIHILLPGEQPFGDGIGVDEGYGDRIDNDIEGTYKQTYTRMFSSNYNIIMSSDNTFEVLIMYHSIKAMLITLFDTLEFAGLQNPKISGQDLQINPELIPPHIFMRAIGLDILTETTVPKINSEKFIKNIEFISESVLI